MKSQLEATEMWLCCVLHGLTKCQIKKYSKSQYIKKSPEGYVNRQIRFVRHIARKSQLEVIALTGMIEGKRAMR